jgi:hypothetical protein
MAYAMHHGMHASAARTDHLTSQTAEEVAIKLIASESLVPWSVVLVNRHISLNILRSSEHITF